jgi:hypothetical protein
MLVRLSDRMGGVTHHVALRTSGRSLALNELAEVGLTSLEYHQIAETC